MPILQLEPSIYPDHLLDGPEATDASWWAMYTQPRREKALMRRLLAWEIPFYCPVVPRALRARSGRLRTSYVPLFANYVFVQGSEELRYRTLTTNCVCQTLFVDDVGALVHDLRQIKRLIDSGLPLTIEARLAPGTPVRVRSGPFQGFEGTVIRRQQRTRLLVAVRFISQSASIELDDTLLEPV